MNEQILGVIAISAMPAAFSLAVAVTAIMHSDLAARTKKSALPILMMSLVLVVAIAVGFTATGLTPAMLYSVAKSPGEFYYFSLTATVTLIALPLWALAYPLALRKELLRRRMNKKP